ncbi:MAG: hypothetical protein ACLGH8_12265 [Bacteroidia bacterium]
MHRLLILIALFILYSATAQQDLRGRVISGDMVIPGIFVIDKRTGAETKTDGQGYFTLQAKPGDRIVVYGKAIEVREFIVTESSFAQSPYVMEAELKGTELGEVTVSRINPETLGLVPKGQKQYTPAERRLKTASEFKPQIAFLLMGGISMPFDPIINAITGRTKMLKKNLKVEGKITGVDKLGDLYTEDKIIRDFGIPAELANGFIYYAVEDAECAEALRRNNKEMVKLRLMVLSEKYLALQQTSQQGNQTIKQ